MLQYVLIISVSTKVVQGKQCNSTVHPEFVLP